MRPGPTRRRSLLAGRVFRPCPRRSFRTGSRRILRTSTRRILRTRSRGILGTGSRRILGTRSGRIFRTHPRRIFRSCLRKHRGRARHDEQPKRRGDICLLQHFLSPKRGSDSQETERAASPTVGARIEPQLGKCFLRHRPSFFDDGTAGLRKVDARNLSVQENVCSIAQRYG